MWNVDNAHWQLDSLTAEIESYVAAGGWEQPPRLFALAHTQQLIDTDPQLAATLGLDGATAAALTPIEQEDLPEGDVEQLLAQIAWPETIVGCALSQEIVFLPPDIDAELDDHAAAATAGDHPQRREARLVVSVLREGTASSMLRLRTPEAGEDTDLLTGQNLAPNLVQALLTTFDE